MKRMMKSIIKILPVVLLILGVVIATTYVDASTNLTIPSTIAGTASNKIKTVSGNVWATITGIVQILAIAAVVFAGLRYMFASADQKADIKKSMGNLAVGAILVFSAATVLRFIQSAANQVIQ